MQFDKSKRLKTPADFKRVYQNRQFGNTKLFSFNALGESGEQINSKLGVTVSKKVSKSAVQRNRIRRLVKEFYRQHQDQLKQSSLVVTAKTGCASADNAEIRAELEILWQKVMKWQRWYQRENPQDSP